MSIPVPPGGRSAPGGVTPPGGEAPPGGQGAPGGQTTPTAPFGRPPRIKLVPLRKHGVKKTVQKVKIEPNRAAQLRQALTPKQRQQQIHQHVKESMPQMQQENQPGPGTHVPPQRKGMGFKGQAHREAIHARVQERRDEIKKQKKAPAPEPEPAGYHTEMAEYQHTNLSEAVKDLAATHTAGVEEHHGEKPAYGVNPPQTKGETVGEYNDRFVAAQEAWNASHTPVRTEREEPLAPEPGKPRDELYDRYLAAEGQERLELRRQLLERERKGS